MTHKPRHIGGTPGASGPPGRNYPVSKPSPAPPGERGGGGYVEPKQEKEVKIKPETGKSGPPGRDYPVIPPKDTDKIAGPIQGLVSPPIIPPKKDEDKIAGPIQGLVSPHITPDKIIIPPKKDEDKIAGPIRGLVSPLIIPPKKDEKDDSIEVFKNQSDYNLWNRNEFGRHVTYNKEMSRTIRNYAQSKGLPRYGNDFVEKLYNFTGAAQAAAQYPTVKGYSAAGLTVLAAGYQLASAGLNVYKQKENLTEAVANATSDFFQNVKGIYSAELYKDDEQFENYEIQLIYDAFNKIDKYVASQ